MSPGRNRLPSRCAQETPLRDARTFPVNRAKSTKVSFPDRVEANRPKRTKVSFPDRVMPLRADESLS